MATHKFRIGQKVQVVAGRSQAYPPAGDYEIVRQLPESDGEYLRAAKESELRRSSRV